MNVNLANYLMDDLFCWNAINIMRKYFLKIKQKIVIDVNGDLYNPIRVNIPCQVPNRQVRNQFGQRLP